MKQPSPPRSQQSLPPAQAPVNAFRRLVVAQGAPLLVAGLVVTVLGYRDADEIVEVWMGLWTMLVIPSSLALTWLAARIDRRVAHRAPVARGLWLPTAAAGVTLSAWVPLLALAPTQLILWIVRGSSRHFGGMMAGLVAWAIVAVAAVVWVAGTRALTRRAEGRVAQRVHLTDTIPTSVVGGAWAAFAFSVPSVAVLAMLQSSGFGTGIAGLVGWALFVTAAATAAVAGVVRAIAPSAPQSAVREVVGATLVAGWLPVFLLVTLSPGWGGHEDQRWVALILTSVAILAGTTLWSLGRADRLDDLHLSGA